MTPLTTLELPSQSGITPVGDPNSVNLFPTSFNGPADKVDASRSAFVPVDPNQVENLALQFDQRGYGLSDADYAARFPQLAAGRNYEANNAALNISGQTDPLLTSTLKTSGLGNVNFGQGEYKQARNMGVGILDKEKRDRNYFSRTLANNPQRTFGLSGQDIAHIALANTNGQNIFNQGAYGAKVNANISAINQDAQNQSAIIGGIGAITGATIKGFASNPYLTAGGYGATNPYPYAYNVAGG